MRKLKILTVFGTRPEVIKLAPFIKAVSLDPDCTNITCATTQSRDLQQDALSMFNIKPDHNLDVMIDGQGLFHITEKIIYRIKPILEHECPDFTVVQGDTTTAFIVALSSFYCKIPVVHIEAGLRTNRIYEPFPEEGNRVLISHITTLHMAPTKMAVNNLAKEGIINNVFHVGNTIVDAIDFILSNKWALNPLIDELLQTRVKKILITVHRRENFGEALKEICVAIKELARMYPQFLFIWPVHPNPNIKEYVKSNMSNIVNLKLLPPISYMELIHVLNDCFLILSDSGGIQEEACVLRKNIIILRNVTERPEVVNVGFGVLAGSQKEKIMSSFAKFIEQLNQKNNTVDQFVYGKPGVSLTILNKMKECHKKSLMR